MAVAVTQTFVTVRCPGCGESRELTLRQASRAGLCRLCRYPPRIEPPTDGDRRYWLKRFDDHELAVLAAAIFGHAVDQDVIRRHREELLADAVSGNGNGRHA